MIGRMVSFLHARSGGLKKCFWAVLVLIALGDFFVPRHETHFAGDRIPMFWTVFGLLGCLAMTAVCKFVLGLLLKRDEDYYEGE